MDDRREPSNALQNPLLLQHLHLRLANPMPTTHQPIAAERVIQELSRAPQMVQNKPVQWQYLHAPEDGTLFIAWQPTNQLGTTYASDGYVWSGPERGPMDHTLQGYRLQIFIAESGFKPRHEQACLHRRTRYRLVSTPNGGHDPQLELVHYTAASPEHRIPSSQVQPNPQIKKMIEERKYLESQGNLTERPFMLHDKGNFPSITVPGNPIPSNPYAQASQMYGGGNVGRGQPQPGGMRGSMGPSPHKRGQQSGGRTLNNPFAGQQQQIPEFLKDEDNHFHGDALDFLTPREISSARYKQHHEWMEEILSSPYDLKQILPVNLGLRLDGELGQLTDGLYGEDAQGGLNTEMIPEVEKRIEDFLKKGEDEIAEMKRTHQEKMEEMAQQKLYAKLERELAGQPDNETLDRVVREAEAATGMRIMTEEPIVQISKGGILDHFMEVGGDTQVQDAQVQDAQDFADFTNMDTAGEALDDLFTHDMDYTTNDADFVAAH